MSRTLGVIEKKLPQGVLCPVTIVAARLVGLGEKGAMTTVLAFHQRNVGIHEDLLAGLSAQTDERVVQRMQDQGRYGDAVEHAGGCSAIVIVISANEARIKRCDAIVKFTQ